MATDRRRLGMVLGVAVTCVVAWPGAAFGRAGSLAQDFGSGGIVEVPGIGTPLLAPAGGGDGTIVIAGEGAASGADPYNGRYYGWNTFGRAAVTRNGSAAPATSVATGYGEHVRTEATATDAAGRTWAAGALEGDAYGNGNAILVVRYRTDGTLDTSFGSGGIVRFEADASTRSRWRVAAVLVAPDGGAVLVIDEKPPGRSVFVRLDAGGAVDRSFGGDGSGRVEVQQDSTAAARLPDGGTLVASVVPVSPFDAHLVLRRHRADGTLEAGWADGGTRDLGSLGAHGLILRVVPAPDGRVVLAGEVARANADDIVGLVARVTVDDGRLDPSFGTSGQADLALGTRLSASGLAVHLFGADVQRDGDVVVAGDYRRATTNGARVDPFVARLTPAGARDPDWGTGGIATPAVEQASPVDLALQDDGDVVVGLAGPQTLLRFTGDGPTAGAPYRWPAPPASVPPPQPDRTPGPDTTPAGAVGPPGAPPSGAGDAAGAPPSGTAALPTLRPRSLLLHRDGTVGVRVSCPAASRSACTGTVRLRVAGRTVASLRIRLRPGASRRLRLRVRSPAVRRARRTAGVLAVLQRPPRAVSIERPAQHRSRRSSAGG